MTKESKNRDLLRRLLKGEKPTLAVSVIDLSDTVTLVAVGGKLNYLTKGKVQPFLDQVRLENPLNEVVITIIDREEYEAICAKLEEEY